MNVTRIRPKASAVQFTGICATCIAALAMLGLSASADEFLLVSPAGLENTEGDTVRMSSPAPPDGFRGQIIFDSSDFSGLPQGHNTMSWMAWRPNFDVTMHNEFTTALALRLSTTDAESGALSNTFADNTGIDETLVYSGPITLQTDGSEDAEGPQPFDYVIEFDPPFVYDPNQGNLLVDLTFVPPYLGDPSPPSPPSPNVDSQTTSLTPAVCEGDAFAAMATVSWTARPVTQFAFVTTGDFDGNAILDATDVDLLSAEVRKGSDDLLFDVNKDKLVDDGDRRVWVEDLKNTFFGDGNLDRKVDSGDLNALALNWQSQDTGWESGDFTGDGQTNAADLNELGLYWQNGVTVAVPEPFAALLTVFALAAVASSRTQVGRRTRAKVRRTN